MGKSEDEMSAEEAALAPEIAGRILGAAPLWDDAAAQQRVNIIGRWIASHTTRPELPWTFGVIDSPEINAFAARSEEHTSELQSLMRISYAVFCLKKKNKQST